LLRFERKTGHWRKISETFCISLPHPLKQRLFRFLFVGAKIMNGFEIVEFQNAHQAWAEQLMLNHMGSARAVAKGVLFNVLEQRGLVAIVDKSPAALLTYNIQGKDCEIRTLHSEKEAMGLGTALIEAVKPIARETGCMRLWLITTNDNIHAIRWYQKRGFTIAAVHVNALEESRKLKPEIPLFGNEGLPLRDEFEFEMSL
jgi:GNAT superfamily N-acetyltransferase